MKNKTLWNSWEKYCLYVAVLMIIQGLCYYALQELTYGFAYNVPSVIQIAVFSIFVFSSLNIPICLFAGIVFIIKRQNIIVGIVSILAAVILSAYIFRYGNAF